MYKAVAMNDLYPLITETLRSGGCVSLMASGVSMMPMLHHLRDSIILEPLTGPLAVNDVILYRRESGQFVLHRIIGVESNGDFVLCGDNQFTMEHNIGYRQVIGRLQAFTHKGHRISCTSHLYKVYVVLLPALRSLYHGLFVSRRYISTVKRRFRRVSGNG